MEKMEKQPNTPPKVMVEAVNTLPTAPTWNNNPVMPSTPQFPETADTPKSVMISAEDKLPLETSPQGFRRTSRPETFAGDNSYLKRPEVTESVTKFPMQMPKPPPGRSVGETLPVAKPKTDNVAANKTASSGASVPVMQRIVNNKGKAVFLADVEIIDSSSKEQVFKGRTNGTGKWMASLPVGMYHVKIRKMEPATKERTEVGQDIQVDGSQSPLELQTMIIK
jgi:hypothetical protein